MAKGYDPLTLNRIQKLEQLEASGLKGFPNTFRPTANSAELKQRFEQVEPAGLEACPDTFRVAGRIMTLRAMGKATFFHVKDRFGTIQVYLKQDVVGEEDYELFKRFIEVGDLVGVSGRMMKTRTGELTVAASKLELVTKTVRTLPEKFHGLQDIEQRFRQRYVDLFMNDWVRDLFILRSKTVQYIRHFLDDRGFLEVETPMMQPIPGGANARPFITHHNALDIDLYLRIAPELYLKRLLVGGLERVYEINRNFRNEGLSHKHNPEFTMLEFYWSYANYADLIDLTEEMLSSLFEKVVGKTDIECDGNTISMARPWRRLTLRESLFVVGDIAEQDVDNPDVLKSYLRSKGVEAKSDWGLGKLQVEVYDQCVEGRLMEPTFITSHPVETSPLSRRNDDNPDVVDRFELIIAGREIANAFSELNDPRDQRARFEAQAKARAAGDEEGMRIDDDYVRALEYGMPPAAGEGIGIDRLVMLAAGVDNIKEVILFPLLRPVPEE